MKPSNGTMEYWKIGILVKAKDSTIKKMKMKLFQYPGFFPLFHHSNIPLFRIFLC